jgi:hypothetical protein
MRWNNWTMLRRKAHRFAIQTKGLTDEQAAQLMYLMCCATDSFDIDYRFECSVPTRLLRATYPSFSWE